MRMQGLIIIQEMKIQGTIIMGNKKTGNYNHTENNKKTGK